MIFVTGGTGLVGAHTLLNLTKKGKPFKALRRNTSSLRICEGVFSHYNELASFSQINWVYGDINDISSLEENIKGCDYIIHCAGFVSFCSSDLELLKKINIEGTANIMNIALSSRVKKLAYVSSVATLGVDNNDITSEKNNFIFSDSNTNYALTKYYAEQEVWRAIAEGLDAVIVNPSVILGPGDWSKGSSQIFQKIYNGLHFYTTGGTGYVDVKDVAESLVRLLFSDIKNERFIVSSENVKHRYLFDMIADKFSKPKASIKVTPLLKELAWRGELIKSFFTGRKPLLTKETARNAMKIRKYSNKKISQELNFVFTDLHLTVKKYCNWYINHIENPSQH